MNRTVEEEEENDCGQNSKNTAALIRSLVLLNIHRLASMPFNMKQHLPRNTFQGS
uniref:Uncharacterized protein n=1 Tax=Amphimedon queenslandica TaxID=400682 RepID=A0A1X7UZ51_AMPQE